MDAGEHPWGSPGGCECSAVAARLMTVFTSLPPGVVQTVVSEAAQELRGQVSSGSQPELTHRLAQCRLAEMSRPPVSTGSTDRRGEPSVGT
jgi:hypothetical protein